MRFRDREEAGRRLGERVAELHLSDPVVLALPRGGVPVAVEVAAALGTDAQVLVARKVGAPEQPELAIAAIAEGSDDIVVTAAAGRLGFHEDELRERAAAARTEIERRVELFRHGQALPDLAGRDVVVVDDGLATGATAMAALLSVRAQQPRRLVLAVPVSAPETARRLERLADDVVCLELPEDFMAVGQWYRDFRQVTDAEVVELTSRTSRTAPTAPEEAR